MEYDNGGNITNKFKCDFSLEETSKLNFSTNNQYGYSVTGWKDKLKTFNNQTCEYDVLGNPTLYRNKVCIWEYGRRLKQIGNVSFTYNASGIRTSKTVDNVTTNYILDGNKVLSQNDGENVLTFHYGADGLTGFNIKNLQTNIEQEYIYQKNIQGDITKIFDLEGNNIVQYLYDSWGNCEITQDTNGIGELNPFRYRSYYYDSSIELYYLQSRYYDSATGRFINADDISELQPSELNGLNLYSYCGNNPIMRIDPNCNEWWHWLVGGLIVLAITAAVVFTAGAAAVALGAGSSLVASIMTGAAIGGVVAGGINIVYQGISNNWSSLNFGDLAFSTFIGGVSGAFGGTSLRLIAQIGINAGLGVIGNVGSQLINQREITDYSVLFKSFILGAFAGIVGGPGAMISGGKLAGAAFWKEAWNASSKTFAKEFNKTLIKTAISSLVKGFVWSSVIEFVSRKYIN